jgi:hypothetical protein
MREVPIEVYRDKWGALDVQNKRAHSEHQGLPIILLVVLECFDTSHIRINVFKLSEAL